MVMKEASIRKLACFGISIIGAWAFISQGWMKTPWYEGSSEFAARFREWGYDPDFAVTVGIVEIIVGLLLIFPRTTSIGSVIGFGVMLGAIYTHLKTGSIEPLFWFAIFLGLISFTLIFLRWPESILNRKRNLAG
jgi:uncharacterized membrane protein YphA (DoxX/SURF4 family)